MKMYSLTIALALLSIAHFDFSRGAPVTDKQEAIEYLRFYEHMPADGGSYEEGLKSFQRMANATQSGQLDSATLEMMNMPRCGNTDKLVNSDIHIRGRRYDAVVRWPEDEITWRVNSFDIGLGKDRTESIMEAALQVWAAAAAITFRKETDPNVDVDFNIEWYYNRVPHGNSNNGGFQGRPFDGPRSVLAHAFFPFADYAGPSIAGDAHFDGDEDFTENTFEGINLFQVAAHEFGHSLGLGHSEIDAALMAPFYRGYQPNFELHSDDVAGIQALYGANSGRPDGTVKPYRTVKPGEACPGTNLDATTRIGDENRGSFLFKGDQVWEVNDDGVADGYPKQISDVFSGLPNNIDAALYYPYNRKTFFFKGATCYVYKDMTLMLQYPISDRWYNLPNDLDAAFIWSGNGRTYFMKGDQYYLVSDLYRSYPQYQYQYFSVDQGYPQSLSAWNLGVNQVDAAFQWSRSRQTYFFANGDVIRFNDRDFQPEVGYPQGINALMFGCGQRLIAGDTDMPNGYTTMPNSAITGVLPNLALLTIPALFTYYFARA